MRSTLSNNRSTNSGANGGGVYLSTSVPINIVDSTLYSNTARYYGGGIYAYAPLTLTGSTVSHNRATTRGGGLYIATPVTVTNSTLSHNTSAEGGGAYIYTTAATFRYSTIVSNSATSSGGGIYIMGAESTLIAQSSIIAAQTQGADCRNPNNWATLTSQGYNIESAISCGFTETSDQQNVSAAQLDLKPLADTGGPTWTHALGRDSVALERIPAGTNGCGVTIATDQRGIARPQDWGADDDPDHCDVGAWEGQPNPPNAVALRSLTARGSIWGGIALIVTLAGGLVLVQRKDALRITPRTMP